MALSQPASPELRRFTFFVSRRLEDGRERFRLHMGYFETLQEAEEWLNIVRDVYPGAWAGDTPGKRLRERAAAEATAQAAAKPAHAPPPPPPPVTHAPRSSAPTVPPGVVVPTLRAAAPEPRTVPNTKAPAPTMARALTRATPPSAPAAARRQPAAPVQRPAAPVAPSARRAPAPAAQPQRAASRSTAPAPAAPVPARAPPAKPTVPGSNVREVLASLDDTGATRQMPAPSAPAPRMSASAAREASLSDSQVLRILEERRGSDGTSEVTETGISLLKPDDTGTRQALKEAVSSNAPVSFAVQLNWSVQPIDLAKVPPLAIFSAYTLYAVEGSRQGRRWYGLRLGFFSDAISAKQVAYYVRSEFSSVAVVPVSPQERDRASTSGKPAPAVTRAAPPTVQDKLPSHASSEFKLFDDTTASPKLPRGAPTAPAAATAAPAATPKRAEPAPSAAKRGGKSSGGKVRGRERRTQSLEETLEILGADQLEIDSGHELLNDTGVRHLKVSIQKNTPFTRLLDRLSERLNKN
jgi:hypothetical protein